MIIKAIKKIVETQTTLLQKKAGTYLECTIDDEVIDCKFMGDNELSNSSTGNYIGVPAPVEMPTDPWFVDPNIEIVKTEKQITHEEMLEEAARREEENKKDKEPEDIHQKMYEMATQNWTTVKEFRGGSEVFQEGPGGWQSGTGMGQYR